VVFRVEPNPSDLEHLAAQLADLERRVTDLEHKQNPSVSAADLSSSARVSESSLPEVDLTIEPAGIVAVSGRAILGIGGAYLP